MKKQWLLLLMGALGCLFTAVNPLSAQIWTLTSAPTNAWSSVASSADGSKLVAAVNGGGIYTSTNSGATWTLTSAGNAGWTGVASSADGTELAAVSWGDDPKIHISTNSGAAWNTHTVLWSPGVLVCNWSAVCLSADGTKLVAAAYSFVNPLVIPPLVSKGSILTSTNSGATWKGGTSEYWSSVASSADGNKLVAAVKGGGIYTSTNSGATWTLTSAANASWTCVASSADGTKLAAVSETNYPVDVHISTNSGATWYTCSLGLSLPVGFSFCNWSAICLSADGTRLTVAANSVVTFGYTFSGWIYTSTNSGATWKGGTSEYWSSVASSADGSKLVAATVDDGIYTCQTTPAPVLSIAPSSNNLALSWLIPSTNFVLQQNSDLCAANWTDVTNNTPALNLTNLQNQVALPLAAGNAFYRLKTP